MRSRKEETAAQTIGAGGWAKRKALWAAVGEGRTLRLPQSEFPLKAESEMKFWMQVVNLGGDPRKHEEGLGK